MPPLQKQTVDFPLAIGRAGGSDPKVLSPNKAIDVLNGKLDTSGKIAKRTGYEEIVASTDTPIADESDESIATIEAVLPVRGSGLLIFGENVDTGGNGGMRAFSIAEQETVDAPELIREGSHKHVSFDVTLGPVETAGTSMSAVDSDGNYVVLSYEGTDPGDSSNRLYVSVQDKDTKSWIAKHYEVASNGSKPYVFSASDKHHLFFYKNSDLFLSTWTPSTDGLASPFSSNAALITTFTSTEALFDMCSDGTHFYCVYYTSANQMFAAKITSAGAIDTTSSAVTATPVNSIGCWMGESDAYLYAAYQEGTNLRVCKWDISNMSNTLAPVTISGGMGTLSNITGLDYIPETATESIVAYETKDTTDAWNTQTELIRIDTSGVKVTGSDVDFPNMGLASKFWKTSGSNQDQPYVMMAHESTLQRSYWVLAFSREQIRAAAADADKMDYCVVARFLYGSARGLRDSSGLPPVVAYSTDKYLLPVVKIVKGTTSGSFLFSPGWVDLNMAATPPSSAFLNDTTYVGGGILTEYGGGFHENGMLMHPENLSVSGTGTAGNLSDGTYSFKGTYEYVDENGDIVRSAASPAISQTLSGGTSDQNANISFPALTMVNERKSSHLRLVLWRTKAGGTTYYRDVDATTNDNIRTSTTWGTTLVGGTTSDADIDDGEILYTDGGVLDDYSAPCPKAITASETRVFVVPSDDPSAVWFSKEKINGVAISFNELLSLRIDRDGPNTALGYMDGNVIVFKSNSIYVFGGAGPNNLGQGSFTSPRQISSDAGCITPQSVVATDQGLFFQSKKGIRLLNRGMQVVPIGSDVEDYKGTDIIASVLMRDDHEVRFLHTDGTLLVYDYENGAWGRHTSSTMLDSSVKSMTLSDGKCVIARTDEIWREKDGQFTDDDSSSNSYALQIDTPWYKLAGINGFQRVYWVAILGEYKTAHTLTINVYYDYVETSAETITVSPSSDPAPYLYRFKPARQRCTAIRFRLADSSGSGTEENMTLTGLSMEIGVKGGIHRGPAARTL